MTNKPWSTTNFASLGDMDQILRCGPGWWSAFTPPQPCPDPDPARAANLAAVAKKEGRPTCGGRCR